MPIADFSPLKQSQWIDEGEPVVGNYWEAGAPPICGTDPERWAVAKW